MHWTNRLFSLMLLLLSMLPTFAQAKLIKKDGLTIVTFNLANYNDHPPWDKRLELIADEIQKIHADVIALQEVRFDPDHVSSKQSYQDMAQQLLYKLNQRGDFLHASLVTQPVMYYPGKNTPLGTHNYPLPANASPDNKSYFWEGLSIISKPKIIETGSRFMTASEQCHDTNKRVTQYVKIQNQGQPLYIVNIHFAYHANCTNENTDETIAYLKHLGNETPLLMLGDFNATPDSLVFAKLRQAGFIDIWRKLQPLEKGYTSTAKKPVKRIDYVLANRLAGEKLTSHEQIYLIGNHPQDDLYPSDHLGIAVRMAGEER